MIRADEYVWKRSLIKYFIIFIKTLARSKLCVHKKLWNTLYSIHFTKEDPNMYISIVFRPYVCYQVLNARIITCK